MQKIFVGSNVLESERNRIKSINNRQEAGSGKQGSMNRLMDAESWFPGLCFSTLHSLTTISYIARMLSDDLEMIYDAQGENMQGIRLSEESHFPTANNAEELLDGEKKLS